MINEIGAPIWTDEEIENAEKERRANMFFPDGSTVKVVLVGFEKEEMTHNKYGEPYAKPWVKHTYHFQREDGKEKVVSDFALKNAFDNVFKKSGAPKLCVGSVLLISASYDGKNYAGYDQYQYDVQIAGESRGAVADKPAVDPELGF